MNQTLYPLHRGNNTIWFIQYDGVCYTDVMYRIISGKLKKPILRKKYEFTVNQAPTVIDARLLLIIIDYY